MVIDLRRVAAFLLLAMSLATPAAAEDALQGVLGRLLGASDQASVDRTAAEIVARANARAPVGGDVGVGGLAAAPVGMMRPRSLSAQAQVGYLEQGNGRQEAMFTAGHGMVLHCLVSDVDRHRLEKVGDASVRVRAKVIKISRVGRTTTAFLDGCSILTR